MPRLDYYLTSNGYFSSRERAKDAIKKGEITVNGEVCSKPALEVSDSDKIDFLGTQLRYVGRGGLKLEAAIKAFKITFDRLICADLGASTGGFTDCMLQNGAAKVFSIDVGHGQLADKLLTDKRVINTEGVNVKDVTIDTTGEPVDFVTADLSFISVKFAITAAAKILKEDGKAVFLIKPQFEAGRDAIGKGGIVKDKPAHIRVLMDIYSFLSSGGFGIIGIIPSPIKGGDGNIEYLAYCMRNCESLSAPDFSEIVNSAFSQKV
ncbi:MAG: TlyA family RNA methyltransferase [Oscillospiraceae bacterium]|nr:TlyA family RNA methyltransferase [Oscillospiraceae bacterium]